MDPQKVTKRAQQQVQGQPEEKRPKEDPLLKAVIGGKEVPSVMRAFVVGSDGQGTLRSDVPVPRPREGEALVRVLRAGICNTDIELMRGYKGGYTGVLGHEFVGEVVIAASAPALVGKRVCGELNINCGSCGICDRGGAVARNHCLRRTVLGIMNHDGTYADYLTLPVVNLHEVPDSVSNEAAVFVEPLAAACRIVEQEVIKAGDKVCIQGDGKLGLLCAEVIARRTDLGAKPILLGRHAAKVAHLGDLVTFVQSPQEPSELAADLQKAFDVVIEATGTPSGLVSAASLARPMGTVVLKSTCASAVTLDTAPFVVHELKVVGSRCGPFAPSIDLVASSDLDVTKYVSAVFPLEAVHEALEMAGTKGCLKVQLAVAPSELGAVGVR